MHKFKKANVGSGRKYINWNGLLIEYDNITKTNTGNFYVIWKGDNAISLIETSKYFIEV